MSMQADRIRTSLTVPEAARASEFPDIRFYYAMPVLHNGLKALVLGEEIGNPDIVRIIYDLPITDPRSIMAYAVKASELQSRAPYVM